jgi:hypothetical protein
LVVSISLVTGSPDEAQVARRLRALLDHYDLSKWQFTDRVQIEQGVLSHSHPILTITAPFGEPLPGDAMLLATYLHEQIHWFTLIRRTDAADEEWLTLYPNAPAEYPEGCGSEFSTYLHFTIAYFEYRALIDVLGPDDARSVIEYKLQRPFYRYVYRTALHDFDRMTTVFDRHGISL